MNSNEQNARTNGRKLLLAGVMTIAISLFSWPIVYLWAAFRMLNNQDATSAEWALAYTCMFGPGIGLLLGLVACGYAIVLSAKSKRSDAEDSESE